MELEFLRELFQAHGVTGIIEGDWVVFPDYGIKANCQLFPPNESASLTTIQMDVRVLVGPGRLIVESFAGMGGAVEQAIADAKQNFVFNSFHVILSAFFLDDSDQTQQEDWMIGGLKRRVTLGNIGMRGNMLEDADITPLFQDFQVSIERRPLSEGVHWIRLYYAQTAHRTLTCEVMLDNAEWPEVQSAMAGRSWPHCKEFYSARLFLIIQGGMGISEAIVLMARHQNEEDDALIATLIAAGFSASRAERFVAFLPVAFGRVLLRSLPIQFAETAVIQNLTTGAERSIQLKEEPIYAEAYRIAEEGLPQGSLTGEEFTAIALRSAEVNVVNQAMAANTQMKNLRMRPLTLRLTEGASASSTNSGPEKPSFLQRLWKNC